MPMTKEPVDTTNKSPLKISIRVPRRGKGQSAQPTPVATKVDTFPAHPRVPLANTRREAPPRATETLEKPGSGGYNSVADSVVGPAIPTADSPEGDVVVQPPLSNNEREDSEVDDIPWSSRKRPAPILPQTKPNPLTYPTWGDRYRKYIQGRGEPLENPFSNVSETIRRNLDGALKTRGGPKGVLAKVTKISHAAFVQQTAAVFKDNDNDNDMDEGSEGKEQDTEGETYSTDVLECIRQMMVLEARIRQSSGRKSGLEDSDLEDEPVPVADYKRRRKRGREQDTGNVLLQCCNDMAR